MRSHDPTPAMIDSKLEALRGYIFVFNRKNPLHVKDELTVLRDGFGDSKFAMWIAKLMHGPDSDKATLYKDWLFARWYEEKAAPAGIFTHVFKVSDDYRGADVIWMRWIAKNYNFYMDKIT
ncbi:hypothetical protein PInf_010159 [Phytophthora infestans]|nr:hypothetical protein PInf_010159 [Phytophthora infestans]